MKLHIALMALVAAAAAKKVKREGAANQMGTRRTRKSKESNSFSRGEPQSQCEIVDVGDITTADGQLIGCVGGKGKGAGGCGEFRFLAEDDECEDDEFLVDWAGVGP